MRLKHATRGAIVALGVLVVAFPGQAQHDAPGDFDFYLLSMSVAPSFCALSPANRSKPDCRDLTPDKFRQTPLTIHGLWPNRAHVSVNRQPSDCSNAAIRLSDATRTGLARYMPGGSQLEEHEWSKHGTCSGLSPDAYFAAAVGLAKQMNDVVGGVMQDSGMLSGEVDVRQLISGVAAKDRALAAAIVVDCKQPRGSNDHVVDEIRFVLTKELKPAPASSVGMGQNSGCPDGIGRIPRVR
jgi:ribonuclease T2